MLLVVEEAGLSATGLTATITAATALIGTQATALIDLRGELADRGPFHDGRWPPAVVDGFSDATVTDGDAKWSVVLG